MTHISTGTKSIDVGSMFLMDLSVHESELNGDLQQNDDALPASFETTYQSLNNNKANGIVSGSSHNVSRQQSIAAHSIAAYHRTSDNQQRDYLGESLDRLASAINNDGGNHPYQNGGKSLINKDNNINAKQSNSMTIVKPQPPPELVEHQSASRSSSSSSSLSDDESFVSSGGSLTSYTASSEANDVERAGSTTTREDSGVLDMKDLDSQHNNSYDNENEEGSCHHNQVLHKQNNQQQQEKPISYNITATNSIATNNNHNHNSFIKQQNGNTSRHDNKPTNDHKHHHNNYHHQRSQPPKRSISASLPIQVPARQMKKDLNKLKLNMKGRNLDIQSKVAVETDRAQPVTTQTTRARSDAVATLDEFLEQEYNDNHHNHYPIDEYEEHLRAEDNPMKLFESIQALARSLHEDAELFGSLPPKRMLESPIRSLALA